MTSHNVAISQEDASESLSRIVWVVYWLGVASAVFSLIPAVSLLSLILWGVSLVLALVKRKDARGTPYASHLGNIITINIVGFVTFILVLLVVVLIPVAGLFIGGAAAITLFIWQVYRLVKGLLRMNDKKAYA